MKKNFKKLEDAIILIANIAINKHFIFRFKISIRMKLLNVHNINVMLSQLKMKSKILLKKNFIKNILNSAGIKLWQEKFC